MIGSSSPAVGGPGPPAPLPEPLGPPGPRLFVPADIRRDTSFADASLPIPLLSFAELIDELEEPDVACIRIRWFVVVLLLLPPLDECWPAAIDEGAPLLVAPVVPPLLPPPPFCCDFIIDGADADDEGVEDAVAEIVVAAVGDWGEETEEEMAVPPPPRRKASRSSSAGPDTAAAGLELVDDGEAAILWNISSVSVSSSPVDANPLPPTPPLPRAFAISSCVNTLLLRSVLSRVVAVWAAVSSVSMSASVLFTFNIFCVMSVSMHLVWRPISFRLSWAGTYRFVRNTHGANTIASELADMRLYCSSFATNARWKINRSNKQ
uniref:Uncharacterized protein n=1 Tax=Anopheles farauti TaxID=69004 RepID=A0A182Q8A3_9DIPT